MPATIDTPFLQHAPNYTGRAVKAMPPVYRNHLGHLRPPPASGSLFSPMGRGASIEGGWRSPNGTSKALKLATASLVGIPAALVWRQYWKETVATSGARGNGHESRGNGRPAPQPH